LNLHDYSGWQDFFSDFVVELYSLWSFLAATSADLSLQSLASLQLAQTISLLEALFSPLFTLHLLSKRPFYHESFLSTRSTFAKQVSL
jgi:hypothetical protein